jgi:hypothetical protein
MIHLKNSKKKKASAKAIFNLVRYDAPQRYDGESDSYRPNVYPEFDVVKTKLGFYSTLKKAESALKQDMKEGIKHEGWPTYCYYICEHPLDTSEMSHIGHRCRSYLPNGDLFDATMTSELPDAERKLPKFKGRTPEQVRFKKGDIVEVLDSMCRVSLGIVFKSPLTEEEVQNRYLRLARQGKPIPVYLNYRDDSYRTLCLSKFEYEEVTADRSLVNDEEWLCGTHDYPLCVKIFPPHLPVPDEMRELLLQMNSIMTSLY